MQKDRDSCTGGSFLVLCMSLLSTWAHNKNHKSKIMGRASKLSPFGQGHIVELHRQGQSCRDIAAELGRSKAAKNNFLRCPEAYGTKKSTGWPKKLSQWAKNAVLRSAQQSSGLSTRQIAAEMASMSARTSSPNASRPRASIEESACADPAFSSITRCGAWSLPGTASRGKTSEARSCCPLPMLSATKKCST